MTRVQLIQLNSTTKKNIIVCYLYLANDLYTYYSFTIIVDIAVTGVAVSVKSNLFNLQISRNSIICVNETNISDNANRIDINPINYQMLYGNLGC